MAKWLDVAVAQLLAIDEGNEALATEIYKEIRRIERGQKADDHIRSSSYVRKDPIGRFRISYEYDGKEVLITVVHRL